MQSFIDRVLQGADAYAPNLLGAVAVLAIGLVTAWLLSIVARRAFARTNLDERIAGWVRGTKNTDGVDSARWLARGVYWGVVSVVLVVFFQILGFTPITIPFTRAIELTVAFLPRLLAGGALAVFAFIVASFLRLLVGRGLQALRIDERVGRRASSAGEAPAPTLRIGAALAQVAYWLTWLLFLPAILSALQLHGVLGPVESMVNDILAFLPSIATAAAIIAAAYLIGRIVGSLVTNTTAAVGVDRLADRLGLGRATSEVSGKLSLQALSVVPSRVLGIGAHVVIVLFAAMEAFDIIAFEQVSLMLADVLGLAGHVVLGLLVFAVGAGLASMAARAVRASTMHGAAMLAVATRVAILVLAGAIALRQMGLANEIISLAFGLMIGGVAAAVAIAFGVGGREVAGRELERWVQSARTRASARTGENEVAIQHH